MSLEIVRLFGVASIQGSPTGGLRSFGVPPGGAFDTESHALANALAGNETSAPTIELSLCRLELRATGQVSFAWVGAGAAQAVVSLEAGQTMVLETPTTGCRSYLAMPGGVLVDAAPLVSGSVLSAKLSRKLRQGRLSEAPGSLSSAPIRVVLGPQATFFSLDDLLSSTYTVSRNLDRVGLRLDAPKPFSHQHELASEPSTPGAFQVPRDGNPILLGPDGPTIGGYPKAAIVIRADMSRVGQLRPDDAVAFQQIEIAGARRLDGERRARLERACSILRALAATNAGVL